eukprot:m.293496 g.293496  ORF g.293496 m.293496 type:complete len:543 (+) comp24443_c0_seq1:141-1769(+)
MTELYNDPSLPEKVSSDHMQSFSSSQIAGKLDINNHRGAMLPGENATPLDSLHQWEGLTQTFGLPPLEIAQASHSPEESKPVSSLPTTDNSNTGTAPSQAVTVASQSLAKTTANQPAAPQTIPADATHATPVPVSSIVVDMDGHDAICVQAALTAALSNAVHAAQPQTTVPLQSNFPPNTTQPSIEPSTQPGLQSVPPGVSCARSLSEPTLMQQLEQVQQAQQAQQQAQQAQLHQQRTQLFQQLELQQQLLRQSLHQQSMAANAVLGLDPLSQLAVLASSQLHTSPQSNLQPIIHNALFNTLVQPPNAQPSPATLVDLSNDLAPIPDNSSPCDQSAPETDALRRWRAMQHAATAATKSLAPGTVPGAIVPVSSGDNSGAEEHSRSIEQDPLHPDRLRAEPARLLAWPGGLAQPQEVRRRAATAISTAPTTSASEYATGAAPQESGPARRRRRPKMAQLTEEERARLRETNRVAARKHRERNRSKKRLTEGFLEVIESRNEELRQEISQLQLEAQTLRDVVMALYLQQDAGRAPERLMPAKPW